MKEPAYLDGKLTITIIIILTIYAMFGIGLGGDVLVAENDIFVGLSSRTNEEGAKQLQQAFPNMKVTTIPGNKNKLTLTLT
jgi:N-dimethylarginine dimethylaminohydrolase